MHKGVQIFTLQAVLHWVLDVYFEGHFKGAVKELEALGMCSGVYMKAFRLSLSSFLK